jgi:hypothetical protein
MNRRSVAILAVFSLVPALLGGCKAPTRTDGVWPAATSDRAVPKPAGVPRWPLTGLAAPSADALLTRVVSVKIENSPAARPQTGLDQADIVYETLAEGGITRFNALFQSHAPKVIGPVRSARPSDFYIVPQYHALFAHCGADTKVRNVLTDRTRFDDMDQFFNPGPYFRAKDRPAPHNLYLDIAKLRAAAISKRSYAATETIQGLNFARAATGATPTVNTLTVPFSTANKVVWRYDAVSHVYKRSVNGVASTDRVTHAQLTARNVVVLWARVADYVKTKHGQVVDITLTGTGRASVFRDGQHFDGTWEAGASAPPVLRAADGSLIGLDAGNTWFQVIANDQGIAMK